MNNVFTERRISLSPRTKQAAKHVVSAWKYGPILIPMPKRSESPTNPQSISGRAFRRNPLISGVSVRLLAVTMPQKLDRRRTREEKKSHRKRLIAASDTQIGK